MEPNDPLWGRKWKVLLLSIGFFLSTVAAIEKEDAELVEQMDFLHRDFSKLHEDFYRDADPALGLEDNAKASIEHFVKSAGLDAELSEEEKAKFFKRALEELILELDNDGFSSLSDDEKKKLFRKELKKALDDQKPCATKRMEELLEAKTPGSYKYEEWMADLSCNDMKMLNGLVMSDADQKQLDETYNSKRHAVISASNDPDGVYPADESVEDEAASFLAVLKQGLDFLNSSLHPQHATPLEVKESLLDEGESTEFNLTSVFDPRTKWSNCAEVFNQIRDQGRCGSCWAQAVAGVAER